MGTTSHISSASAEAATVSMPSHQAGDLIIAFAWRGASSTIPTLPSGWTKISTNNAGSNASICAYKIAANASETTGTWTNASMVAVGVWRDSANYLLPGNTLVTRTTSTNITFGAVQSRDSTHTWFAGFVAATLNSTNTETPPTNMTNRTSTAGASAGEIAIHDTNGVSGDWPSTNVAVSSQVSHAYVIELFDSQISKTSASGIKSQGSMSGGMAA